MGAVPLQSAMFSLILTNILGLIIGIFSSMLAWWILFHRFIPKINFSPNISKTKTDDCKSEYRYRFKMNNMGRKSVINLEIMANFRFKGIGPILSNYQDVDIPLGSEVSNICRISNLSVNKHKIIRLYFDKHDGFKSWKYYPENIKENALKDILLLEDILKIGEDASIQIQAFGYDEFSGARKLFLSKHYILEDIKEGDFEKASLKIKD